MTKFRAICLLFFLLYPMLNVVAVVVIVKIDNFFLISMTYPAIFGGLIPLIVLAGFWRWVWKQRTEGVGLVFPILGTLGILAGGALHFFIIYIASASI